MIRCMREYYWEAVSADLREKAGDDKVYKVTKKQLKRDKQSLLLKKKKKRIGKERKKELRIQISGVRTKD